MITPIAMAFYFICVLEKPREFNREFLICMIILHAEVN